MTLEGRAVLASYDAGADMLTVWSATQTPHLCRATLADCSNATSKSIRVDRAPCRRRLRHEGAVLRRGGGHSGRGDEARPPGGVAGGPARAFSVGDAGARSALEGGDCGRCRRQTSSGSPAPCCTTPEPSCPGASSRPISQRRPSRDPMWCRPIASRRRSCSPTACRPRSCAAPAGRRRSSPWSD